MEMSEGDWRQMVRWVDLQWRTCIAVHMDEVASAVDEYIDGVRRQVKECDGCGTMPASVALNVFETKCGHWYCAACFLSHVYECQVAHMSAYYRLPAYWNGFARLPPMMHIECCVVALWDS